MPDVLVAEAATEENIAYAPWGGDTVAEKKQEIFRFHFSPSVLARIANEANVKTIVLSHEQNYNSGSEYDALGLVKRNCCRRVQRYDLLGFGRGRILEFSMSAFGRNQPQGLINY